MKQKQGDYIRRYWFLIFLVLFLKKNHFLTKDNHSEKNVIGEEERECIDMDGIRNLEGLLRES